jgi:hypothetical protein
LCIPNRFGDVGYGYLADAELRTEDARSSEDRRLVRPFGGDARRTLEVNWLPLAEYNATGLH